jgi:hypothetical protein
MGVAIRPQTLPTVTLATGKIAWAHLNEFPDYYTRLGKVEAEVERDWPSEAAARPGSARSR